MSVIHFKFKNSLDYDSITFDGLHLSLKDLKKFIIQKKRLKSEEVDLQVINAQTREEYKDNEQLIPRNTSVVIARVPVNTGNAREPAVSRDKVWEAFRMTTQAAVFIIDKNMLSSATVMLKRGSKSLVKAPVGCTDHILRKLDVNEYYIVANPGLQKYSLLMPKILIFRKK